jgi:hypothetical protein
MMEGRAQRLAIEDFGRRPGRADTSLPRGSVLELRLEESEVTADVGDVFAALAGMESCLCQQPYVVDEAQEAGVAVLRWTHMNSETAEETAVSSASVDDLVTQFCLVAVPATPALPTILLTGAVHKVSS